MKTAISIPDDLFADADALAKQTGQSRSELYARAIREYVARNMADEVTAALDDVYAREESVDGFVHRAADTTLRRVEW